MNVVVDVAAPEDDAGIRGLMRRQAMPGRVRMAFCREPDFSIGCAATGMDYRILVARAAERGEIVGVACRSTRRVFLDGRAQRIGYLGQLRVDERFRGRWLVARGFSMLQQIDREDPLPCYLASIVDGNAEATGVLVGTPRRSFPSFREVAAYRTLAIRTRRPRASLPGPETIAPLSEEHIPDLVRFLHVEGARYQLFTVWTEDAIRRLGTLGLRLDDILIAERDGEIVGTAALWDQSAYKQSVVQGYTGWLRLCAPFLPRAGHHIRSAYASLVCVANDDERVLARLLREVYNRAVARRFDYLVVGLDARDPALAVVRRYPHVSYPSRLYLGSWPNGGFAHVEPDGLSRVDVGTL